MTVRELIAQLQQQHPDTEVWHGEKHIGQVTTVERCRLEEDFYWDDGTSRAYWSQDDIQWLADTSRRLLAAKPLAAKGLED